MTTFDPKSNSLPKRSELEDIPGAPKGAAWFWGKDDEVSDFMRCCLATKEIVLIHLSSQLGRLNLLTDERRLAAAKLITSGETVNLEYVELGLL
jgi:hypothetical protein